MSHSRERAEKICLNCNSEIYGRFCHVCGQENVDPKESAWHVITHFFNDITHFDGKFFQTLKYLIFKPGFLSREYMEGRRAKYLHPIRMYVFTSFVFFLSFYAIADTDNWDYSSSSNQKKKTVGLEEARKEALQNADTHEDSVQIEKALAVMQGLKVPVALVVDSTDKKEDTSERDSGISILETKYTSNKEYDSLQRLLPLDERDGWFERSWTYQKIELNAKYGKDEKRFWRDVFNKFVHTFPTLLFVSLPLYALFLKLLYVRRSRFYYVDHGIFLIHLYIFTFIVLLVLFGLYKLDSVTDTSLIGWVMAALLVYGLIYTIRAMRNFYAQGWFKTLTKFFLFNVLATVALSILFILFFVFSIYRA